MRNVIACVAVLTLCGAGFVQAQSLGEAAAREKERREKQKGEPKVMTEAELSRARGRGLSVTDEPGDSATSDGTTIDGSASTTTEGGEAKAPKSPAAAGAAVPPPKTDDELRAEAETQWRERVDKANAEVSRLQGIVERLEGNQGLYTNQGLKDQHADAVQKLEAARATLESLEDERRRAGYR
jgi:hypothetical protein